MLRPDSVPQVICCAVRLLFDGHIVMLLGVPCGGSRPHDANEPNGRFKAVWGDAARGRAAFATHDAPS